MNARTDRYGRGIALSLIFFILLLTLTALARGQYRSDDPDIPFDPMAEGAEWNQINPIARDTVRIAPGKHYDRGGLHRAFFGDLWRDLWGTEISVPVLDLQKTGGGLTPTKVGGGKQTSSLRFEGEDGREYKFRSVDKDPTSVLPKTLQKTFVDGIMQDVISSGNPAGAIVAAPILDAVGIINAHPFLYVLPDDPALGEYREQFAGMLGTLEEHPNEGPDDTPGFYGFTKIYGSDEFYEDLRKHNHDRIDYHDYLKARLVDMLINDWDRHMDQYRWARYVENGERRYRPIPRDRDQAFSVYDGLIPWSAQVMFPEIEGMDDEYPDIEDLTFAGKTLDRRFLVPISRQEWDSITGWVVARLDNNLLDAAIARMPPEYIEIAGEEITRKLRARRDALPQASEDLYELVRRQAEIWGSNDDEYITVERFFDGSVRVSLYRRNPATGEPVGDPYLRHTFASDETDEIRIMMLDGDDKVVVSGEVDHSITVRVDGGDGADDFVDESKVNGYFFFTPIPDAETSTYFYDSGKKARFAPGPGTRLDRNPYPEWNTDTAAWRPPYRDYGGDRSILPWLSYSSDEGIFLGAKWRFRRFGFRQNPYLSTGTLGAGYAFGTSAFKAEFDGEFRELLPRTALFVNAFASELEVLSFFGLGNTTRYDAALDDAGFYDIAQRQFSLTTDLRIPKAGQFGIFFGLEANHTRTQLAESPILDSLKPYGVEPTTLAGLRTGVEIDSRNSLRAPTDGILFRADTRLFPDVLDNRENFIVLEAEARTYLSWDVLRPTTLALRARIENIFGDQYPYYKAAYLGGNSTLRGYPEDRFAGDRSFLGNVELRMHLFDYKLITRNRLGIVGFFEAGRVSFDGEREADLDDFGSWHEGYGGGVALSFVNPEFLVVFTVGKSEEEQLGYYINLGHSF